MMNLTRKSSFVSRLRPVWVPVLAAALIMTGCDPENPDGGEEEITTVKVALTAAGTTTTYTWKDGATPDKISLSPNTTYTAAVTFLNENETPAEDITLEVKEEGDEHLVCYTVSGANLTITRTDDDGTGKPIGLAAQWVTLAASTGSLILELRHQPGVKDGSCTPGDTDVEVTFDVEVK
ncbi:MAG: hypothetical protein SF053_11110 [Bacteroidia bacterium]|nr:hypothetical protein [Bacteroidia bacterium]